MAQKITLFGKSMDECNHTKVIMDINDGKAFGALYLLLANGVFTEVQLLPNCKEAYDFALEVVKLGGFSQQRMPYCPTLYNEGDICFGHGGGEPFVFVKKPH